MKRNKLKICFGYQCLLLVFMLCCFAQCSTVHVYQAGNQQGLVEGNQPGTEWTDGKRVNIFFWGGMRQDVIVSDCRMVDGSRLNIEEIKIEKNFGSILAQVLTLGFWETSKVYWKCAKPKVPTGELE